MGFPHSDISGSKYVGNSPELFAAYHVLHRLSVPRHPPNALVVLDLTTVVVSEDRSHDRSSARSVQGTTPTTKTALYSTYPFLPLRLGDGARKSRLQTSLSDEQCQRTIRCRRHRVSLHLCDGGGGRRDRTDDLLLAKQALSQLSYAPV
jgi:hypothetical protein